MFVERVLQIRNVGLMMLVMMDLHRLPVDVRLERPEIVRQGWQLETRELGHLRHRSGPVEGACQTPHCAGQFPAYYARRIGALQRPPPPPPPPRRSKWPR